MLHKGASVRDYEKWQRQEIRKVIASLPQEEKERILNSIQLGKAKCYLLDQTFDPTLCEFTESLLKGEDPKRRKNGRNPSKSP